GYQWIAALNEQQQHIGQQKAPPATFKANSRLPSMFSLRQRQIAVVLLAVSIGAAVFVLIHSDPRPLTRIQSIAVLPLEYLSGDQAQDYLADGITEALINSLAQAQSLRIISRTSVMRFKGSRKPLPQIARELDVDALITGSFSQSNGHARVTIQLIDGATDTHLWATQYERQVSDIFKLNTDVATAVVEKIQFQITPEDGSRMVLTDRKSTRLNYSHT